MYQYITTHGSKNVNIPSLHEMIETLGHQHKETEILKKKKYNDELTFKITSGLPDERQGDFWRLGSFGRPKRIPAYAALA